MCFNQHEEPETHANKAVNLSQENHKNVHLKSIVDLSSRLLTDDVTVRICILRRFVGDSFLVSNIYNGKQKHELFFLES